MVRESINRLQYLTEVIPRLLREIGDQQFSFKSFSDKWSKKEIIGHLIDSATNNHHRFIRGQFEENPEIKYDQNKWNEYGFYQQIESEQLILFWTVYNKQLVEIIKRIPEERFAKEIRIGDNTLTLEYLIIDYVAHTEHHLKQVVSY